MLLYNSRVNVAQSRLAKPFKILTSADSDSTLSGPRIQEDSMRTKGLKMIVLVVLAGAAATRANAAGERKIACFVVRLRLRSAMPQRTPKMTTISKPLYLSLPGTQSNSLNS